MHIHKLWLITLSHPRLPVAINLAGTPDQPVFNHTG